MRRDQASELRSMVLHGSHPSPGVKKTNARMLAVLGGKGGVGTTTIALNLSVALAQLGHRVVVVDAHLGRSDIASLCCLREKYGIGDVVSSQRDLHEALQPGPVGIQVLPGTWASETRIDCSEFSRQRFIQRVRTLEQYADWIVLDTGSSPADKFSQNLCYAADHVLLVTCKDTVSVMDTYATIKTLVQQGTLQSIQTLVNQCFDKKVSADIQQRLQNSCQQFLNVNLSPCEQIPLDPLVRDSAELGVPFMTKSPTCQAARAMEKLAAHFVALAQKSTSSSTTHQSMVGVSG
ncbi:MAG: hypothetical protein CMJ81_20660 [Planctomycetaceae bacterium]|nr:hypothetical protein [Planctomycetaceae bacterium]MBP62453.1 hypothetical protein [Planctomycetaceae bacterium]